MAESSKDESMPAQLEGLIVVKTRSYGETKVTIYGTAETLP